MAGTGTRAEGSGGQLPKVLVCLCGAFTSPHSVHLSVHWAVFINGSHSDSCQHTSYKKIAEKLPPRSCHPGGSLGTEACRGERNRLLECHRLCQEMLF